MFLIKTKSLFSSFVSLSDHIALKKFNLDRKVVSEGLI